MDEIPIACALSGAEQQSRVTEWRQLKLQAITRELEDHEAQLGFAPEAAIAGSLADLAVREAACCPFFTFTLSIASGQVVLTVTGPDDAKEILAALVH
jgi:hypothetical protein